MTKKTFYLMSALTCGALLLAGCEGEKKPEPDPAAEAARKLPVRCPKCGAESEAGSYKTLNQVMARCPKCNAAVNFLEARSKQKK